jgi:endonuclease-8
MHGSWRLQRSGERWPAARSRAWIALSDGNTEAVNFGGSTLRIATEAGLRRDPRLARLGPDLLADDFDAAAAARSLRRPGPAAELGEALLDQAAVAGIGNIFKSEGCSAAGLDPWQALGELGDEELTDVLGRTRSLMLAAAEGRRRPSAVYRRAGTPCGRCGQRIRSRRQGDAARTTYWCPRCQGGG